MSTKTWSLTVVTAAFASLAIAGAAWANGGRGHAAEPTVAQPTGTAPGARHVGQLRPRLQRVPRHRPALLPPVGGRPRRTRC